MHYSYDGGVFLNVMIKKVEYLIPAVVVIKALEEMSDRQLYNKIVKGSTDNSFISERVEILISEIKKRSLFSQSQCLSYLGFLLRAILNVNDPDLTNDKIGEIFLKEHIMVHCKSNGEKVGALVLMLQKLYALVNGTLEPDNLDSLVNHEILLSGHLYMSFFREKLEEVLQGVKGRMIREIIRGKEIIRTRDFDFVVRAIETQTSIGHKIQYLLATGNLKSQSGLDLMQNSGYSIIAEKLNNMRFFSHMRSLHRGAYFTEMKTTKVRKLLPENWGFLCPVHTPDGGLCGLLNHLSYGCIIQCYPQADVSRSDFTQLCCSLGMHSVISNAEVVLPPDLIQVVWEGTILGYIGSSVAQQFVDTLREMKVNQIHPNLLHKYTSLTYIAPSIYPKMT